MNPYGDSRPVPAGFYTNFAARLEEGYQKALKNSGADAYFEVRQEAHRPDGEVLPTYRSCWRKLRTPQPPKAVLEAFRVEIGKLYRL